MKHDLQKHVETKEAIKSALASSKGETAAVRRQHAEAARVARERPVEKGLWTQVIKKFTQQGGSGL